MIDLQSYPLETDTLKKNKYLILSNTFFKCYKLKAVLFHETETNEITDYGI